MSKGTPLRNIRVADELWNAAKDRAAAEGRTVSDVLVAALRRYVMRPPPQTQRER